MAEPIRSIVAPYLKRGGMLAWGIVPTSTSIKTETAETLQAKLETAMDNLASKGIDKELICQQAIITPSCGTGSMQPDDAFKVFETTPATIKKNETTIQLLMSNSNNCF